MNEAAEAPEAAAVTEEPASIAIKKHAALQALLVCIREAKGRIKITRSEDQITHLRAHYNKYYVHNVVWGSDRVISCSMSVPDRPNEPVVVDLPAPGVLRFYTGAAPAQFKYYGHPDRCDLLTYVRICARGLEYGQHSLRDLTRGTCGGEVEFPGAWDLEQAKYDVLNYFDDPEWLLGQLEIEEKSVREVQDKRIKYAEYWKKTYGVDLPTEVDASESSCVIYLLEQRADMIQQAVHDIEYAEYRERLYEVVGDLDGDWYESCVNAGSIVPVIVYKCAVICEVILTNLEQHPELLLQDKYKVSDTRKKSMAISIGIRSIVAPVGVDIKDKDNFWFGTVIGINTSAGEDAEIFYDIQVQGTVSTKKAGVSSKDIRALTHREVRQAEKALVSQEKKIHNARTKEAFGEIDEERDHQKEKWGFAHDHANTRVEWEQHLQRYMDKLKGSMNHVEWRTAAIKIAALGVAILENAPEDMDEEAVRAFHAPAFSMPDRMRIQVMGLSAAVGVPRAAAGNSIQDTLAKYGNLSALGLLGGRIDQTTAHDTSSEADSNELFTDDLSEMGAPFDEAVEAAPAVAEAVEAAPAVAEAVEAAPAVAGHPLAMSLVQAAAAHEARAAEPAATDVDNVNI